MPNLGLLRLLQATWETIYMVSLSSLISFLFGGCLGLLLFATKKKHLCPNKWLNRYLEMLVNATRSLPFIVLLICVLPLTRLLVGSTIGTHAAIVPLTLAAVPFFARICDSVFTELPEELMETATAMGTTPWQFISKFLIPESASALIKGMSLTLIGLIGYSAMAGAVGGGGLGELAINYGYQRFDTLVMFETVIVLILLVQFVQWGSDLLAKKRALKRVMIGGPFVFLACLLAQFFLTYGAQKDAIKVGVPAGWSEEVMAVAKQVALKQFKMHLDIVPFSDYVLPNAALAHKDIDVNIFQHAPYLATDIKANHYRLVPIAKTFIYPMGFYSKKIKSLSSLTAGSIVAMPSDPSNQARSLLLLQKAGLITLRPHVGAMASLNDIIQNDKQLQFKLLDAAFLPRALPDADLVAITNDYVHSAGLNIKDALLKEGADSLYANIIVVREADKDKPVFQKLIAIMHAHPVLERTQKLFPNGAALAAW